LTQNAENCINQIVGIDGLAAALVMKKRTLLRRWRTLPHFFAPMAGHDARAARFDIQDFINFMTGQVDEVMNDYAGMEEFELFLEKTED